MDSGVQPVAKKRSGRRKSRFGCRNCKLRKLKCDETRPHCLRCRTYGVLCNFGLNVPDLQPLSEKRAKQEIASRTRLPSPRPAISNAIWADDGSTFFMLDSKDQELFNRFRYRTVYSLGGPAMVDIYENYMLWASFTCTILFNKRLDQDIREEDKDPLWAAAGSIAILTFSSINACLPEEAWPLGPPDPSHLDWLRLGSGKMALWHLLDPLRSGSVFRSMSETFRHMHQPLPERGNDGVLADLAHICGLSESSTPENNPYFTIAHSLSRLLEIPRGGASQNSALGVASRMHNGFRICLEKKDPVALLLLCLWYSRARETRWWIDFRARYEIPAICTYLQRYYHDNSAIQALIPWDEMKAVV